MKVGYATDIIVYDQEKLGFLYDQPVHATDFLEGARRTSGRAVVAAEEQRL